MANKLFCPICNKKGDNVSSWKCASCSTFSKIVILEGVESVPKYNNDIKYAEEVIIPKTVKKIESFTFSGCTSLKKISIPDGIEEIGDYAFSQCYNLVQVVLPSSLKKIGKCAFNTSHIWYETTATGRWKTKNGHYLSHTFDSKLKRVMLPSSVEEIGEGAFGYSSKDICYFVPNGSVAAKYAKASGATVVYAYVIQGVLLGVPAIDNTLYYVEKYNKKHIISKGIETIAEYAFYGCDEIEELVIPASVKKICTHACSGAEKVSVITFETNSNLQCIESKAFDSFCGTMVDLPSTIVELAPNAFPKNCIVSVGGEMPGYAQSLAELEKDKSELDDFRLHAGSFVSRIDVAQKRLDDHVRSYSCKFNDIPSLKSQIKEIEDERNDEMVIIDDECTYLNQQIKGIDSEIKSIVKAKEECFFFAFARKKELDEDLARKQAERRTFLGKLHNMNAKASDVERSHSQRIGVLTARLNSLCNEQKKWNATKDELTRELRNLQKSSKDVADNILEMETKLRNSTKKLEDTHRKWLSAKTKEEEKKEKLRREAEELERTNKLKSEKAEILAKLNVPQYDKIPTYWFTSRDNVIEEGLLNDSFIRMIVALNENNEANSRNAYIEKNKTKIERIKAINGLLGCPENEGLLNLMPVKAPEVAKRYIPERFERLTVRFSELEAWGDLKKSAGELFGGVYDSKSNLKRFFGKNDPLKLDAEKQQLLIFPHCMVAYPNGGPLFVLTYDKTVLDIECVEEEMVTDIIPEYGELIGERHKHLNQDGSVSRRYKDNPVIKTIRYTTITVKSASNSYAFPMKTYQDAVQIKQVYDDYRSFITTDLVGQIYDLFLQSKGIEIIENALDNLELEIQTRIEQEKKKAEEEMRRREEERAAAHAAAEEKRRAIIQRQRELNEERKREAERQAEMRKKVVQMFDDDFEPTYEEIESGTSKNISLPVEIAGNRTITNNVFKVSVKALKDFDGDLVTYFVTSSGEIISNKKKVPALHDAEQAQIGFILNSGIDYTTMHKCCMRLESDGVHMGDIEFDMNISFYSDF